MERLEIRKDKNINYIFVEANPELGFNFPFLIFIPDQINEEPKVVYAWNLLKDKSDYSFPDPDSIKRSTSSFDPMLMHLTFDLGYPCILPLIPRMNDFRPNFLGKEFLNNDFSIYKEILPEDEMVEIERDYYDLPNQVKNIINHGINIIKENGISVDDKVIMSGYSEGAKGASHFSLLHPEIIKSLILGGTGGCISMPVKEYNGYTFNYPTGINDVKNFNMEDFSNISFFYYVGKDDKSDSAIPKFEVHHYIDENGEEKLYRDECNNVTPFFDENGNANFILDENGNYMAMHSLFNDEEVNSINKALGIKVQDRFNVQESIYDSLELNAIFFRCHGNHQTIFDEPERSILFKAVDNFLNDMKRNKCK